MSDNTMPVITVDEMKTRTAACVTLFEAIQTRLQYGVSAGPTAAQTARLLALTFARQGYKLLENVHGIVQYLSQPTRIPSPEGESKHTLDKVMEVAEPIAEKPEHVLVGALVEVAQEMIEAIMEQFGVQKEAIPAFLYETNAYLLPVIEDLLAAATAKLNEADALTAAATQAV